MLGVDVDSVIAAAVVVAFFILFGVFGYLRRRRRREARDSARLSKQAESNLEPASLHPVIDPDICIGSLSCITACPEGDILGIVNGAAKLIVGSNCIGHGRCAIECPVDAIKLVFGSAARGLDLPEVSETFESSRKGLHIVGELAGMGLIRNALHQGLQLAEHFSRAAKTVASESSPVFIVGAGPAGIATAVGLRYRRIPFRLVDQGTRGGTTAQYPRHKIVMTETVHLPGYGKFGKRELSKDTLMKAWDKVLKKTGIRVEAGVKVTGIEGTDGDFLVRTSSGDVAASKVVLAIGRRGSPRQIGVPGEASSKVVYSLMEAEQYANQRVLIVGGGDSAIEAALTVSEQPGATVTISYRGDELAKCREANRNKIRQAIERGTIAALLPSTVQKIEEDYVEMKVAGKDQRLGNDYVIACLGGELPHDFLKAAGVTMTRHYGTKGVAPPSGKKQANDSRLGWMLAAIGFGIVALLTLVGWQYYLLPPAERVDSRMHEVLRPSGVWGHGIGIASTLFMLLNFLYPVRKRTRFLKGTAPIRSWLTFHVFVGLMSPVLIGFHAAFHSRNLLATSTFISLSIVAVTGIIGRFIFALAPTRMGAQLEVAEVMAQLERHRRLFAVLEHKAEDKASFARIERELDEHRFDRGSILWHLLSFPWLSARLRRDLLKVRKAFPVWKLFDSFRDEALAVHKLQFQVRFFRNFKTLLSAWRAFHVVLAVFLVVVMSVHIAVSLLLGYQWIFSS